MLKQVNENKNLRLTLRLKIRTRLILGFRIKEWKYLKQNQKFPFLGIRVWKPSTLRVRLCSNLGFEQPTAVPITSKHQAAAAEGACDGAAACGGVGRECGSDSGGRVLSF